MEQAFDRLDKPAGVTTERGLAIKDRSEISLVLIGYSARPIASWERAEAGLGYLAESPGAEVSCVVEDCELCHGQLYMMSSVCIDMPGISTAEAHSVMEKVLPPGPYHDLLDKGPYPDELRQHLSEDGYYVVKNAIPADRALSYRDRGIKWLENFNLGFKYGDQSTYTNKHLPRHVKGGMFFSRIYHEQWLWDVRTEAGVVDAFAKIWGTEKLTTSFDGGSVMLCHRKDLPKPEKWEHIDSSAYRQGFFCVQGLANLNDNGPEDGGLMVLRGSSRIVEEYFRTHPDARKKSGSWGPSDWYGFTLDQQQWFFDRGCEWVKVCGQPGDLFLWDSRTMHYNQPPSPASDRTRVCTYICMAPDDLLNDKDRATKANLFKIGGATTHNPYSNIFARDETEDKDVVMQEPVKPTDQILKLAAVKRYE